MMDMFLFSGTTFFLFSSADIFLLMNAWWGGEAFTHLKKMTDDADVVSPAINVMFVKDPEACQKSSVSAWVVTVKQLTIELDSITRETASHARWPTWRAFLQLVTSMDWRNLVEDLTPPTIKIHLTDSQVSAGLCLYDDAYMSTDDQARMKEAAMLVNKALCKEKEAVRRVDSEGSDDDEEADEVDSDDSCDDDKDPEGGEGYPLCENDFEEIMWTWAESRRKNHRVACAPTSAANCMIVANVVIVVCGV
jgi:hypothetical protein